MRIRNRLVLLCLIGAATPASAVQRAPVRLEPMARIGCQDCPEPAMLTRVHGLAMDQRHVYVLDGSDPYVRVFDHNGRLVRAYGRRGDGPGEFRNPIHLSNRTNGEVTVFDLGGRVTRFDSLGRPLETHTIKLGQFPAISSRADNPATYLITSDFRDTAQHLIRLGQLESDPTRLVSREAYFPIDQRTRAAARPSLAARPGGGVAVGTGRDQYRILLLGDDGRLERVIVRNVRPVPKTRAEISAERASYARLRQLMSSRVPRDQLPPEPDISKFRRHFSGLRFDEKGRLWVKTQRGDATVAIFDLFDASGGYMGELRLPGQFGAIVVLGNRLAAMTSDDTGTPYIMVWRITYTN